MSATCPSGHLSTTTDYCDQCGARIEHPPAESQETADAAVEASAAVEGSPDSVAIVTSSSAVTNPCPDCGSPRAGGDRYCEGCGYDFVAARSARVSPPSGPAWAALVLADRDYFARIAPDGVDFPEAATPRVFVLDRPELRIGRGRPSGDVDVCGAAGDPAISRLHATLVRQADGSYSVVDHGSSNGTTINEDPAPIAAHVPVQLSDGDQVHLGAWTTIVVQHAGGARADG